MTSALKNIHVSIALLKKKLMGIDHKCIWRFHFVYSFYISFGPEVHITWKIKKILMNNTKTGMINNNVN